MAGLEVKQRIKEIRQYFDENAHIVEQLPDFVELCDELELLTKEGNSNDTNTNEHRMERITD